MSVCGTRSVQRDDILSFHVACRRLQAAAEMGGSPAEGDIPTSQSRIESGSRHTEAAGARPGGEVLGRSTAHVTGSETSDSEENGGPSPFMRVTGAFSPEASPAALNAPSCAEAAWELPGVDDGSGAAGVAVGQAPPGGTGSDREDPSEGPPSEDDLLMDECGQHYREQPFHHSQSDHSSDEDEEEVSEQADDPMDADFVVGSGHNVREVGEASAQLLQQRQLERQGYRWPSRAEMSKPPRSKSSKKGHNRRALHALTTPLYRLHFRWHVHFPAAR